VDIRGVWEPRQEKARRFATFCLDVRASAVGEGASRLYRSENVRGEQMRQARLSDDMHVSHNRIQFGG
jgi:hypothetical protein